MGFFKNGRMSFLCFVFLAQSVLMHSDGWARAIPNARHIPPSDVLRVISTEKGLHSERCRFDLSECRTMNVLTPAIIAQVRQQLSELSLKDFSQSGMSNELERPSWTVLGSYAAIVVVSAFVAPPLLAKFASRVGLRPSTLHALEGAAAILGTGAFAYDLRQRMLIGPQQYKAHLLKNALLETFDQTLGVIRQMPTGEVRTMALPQWVWDEIDLSLEQASVREDD